MSAAVAGVRQGVEQRRSRCRKAMEAIAGTAEDPAAEGGDALKFIQPFFRIFLPFLLCFCIFIYK